MNEFQSNSFLAEQPVGALMRKFSLPCILSLLVGALYNIVDQLFIANASYLGSYGNAANSVVFPLTVIALAIATMIGDGCCAYVSIRLGAGEQEQAHRSVGNAIVLTLIVSVVLTAVYLIFMDPILTAFGATVNAETFALSREYCFWIALGIPFYMFGQAMNPIIRADGNPKFAMVSTLAGAVINILLDPILIFGLFGFPAMGVEGAAVATIIGQMSAMLLSFLLFFFGKYDVGLKIRGFRFSMKTVRSIYAVAIPSTVMMSASVPTSSSALASRSMTVMSWPLPLSIVARWLPISPAPAMTIFIIALRCFPPPARTSPASASVRRDIRPQGSCRRRPSRANDRGRHFAFCRQMYKFVAESTNFPPLFPP